MKELVENTEDINDLRIRLHIVNLDIQIESFGITWEGQGKQKKKMKRDSKELNQLFKEQNEEMDKMLEEGSSAKDLNSKIYKVKEMINCPKIKASEPMCINDPTLGEIVTVIEMIKA